MIQVADIDKMRQLSRNWQADGQRIALVPTMGYLHDGHLSLVDLARKAADRVIVSIFVNPTQFNDPKDLERYPRNLQTDADLLEAIGCDYIYSPEVDDIYPSEDKRIFDFGGIGFIPPLGGFCIILYNNIIIYIYLKTGWDFAVGRNWN